jgi:hypothetical protein
LVAEYQKVSIHYGRIVVIVEPQYTAICTGRLKEVIVIEES